MSNKFLLNPFTGEFDFVGPPATASIPEYTTDPVSPAVEDAWVLHTVPTGAGVPIGLLLALTYSGTGTEKWEFSYKTSTGGIKRVEIT